MRTRIVTRNARQCAFVFAIVNKFERKKVVINHIDEIHSCDLVDMVKYSRVNRGYKYIFTNIDIFSKIAYAYPIKSKKYKTLNLAFKKYS